MKREEKEQKHKEWNIQGKEGKLENSYFSIKENE